MTQGTLWDMVASMVAADAQPAAPRRLSQHETLAKTLLLLPLVSQGVPLLTQVYLRMLSSNSAQQAVGEGVACLFAMHWIYDPCAINVQDIVDDERLLRAAAGLHRMRRLFAAQLTPAEFKSPRDIRWHGATPGAHTLLQFHHLWPYRCSLCWGLRASVKCYLRVEQGQRSCWCAGSVELDLY